VPAEISHAGFSDVQPDWPVPTRLFQRQPQNLEAFTARVRLMSTAKASARIAKAPSDIKSRIACGLACLLTEARPGSVPLQGREALLEL
jgi:hypothetical protein